MPRVFIGSFPCASNLIASDSLFLFSCEAIAMRLNNTRMVVIHERQASLFFDCRNNSLIHRDLLFSRNCLLLMKRQSHKYRQGKRTPMRQESGNGQCLPMLQRLRLKPRCQTQGAKTIYVSSNICR